MKRAVVVVLLLLALPALAPASEPAELSDLLSGKAAPLAMKLKDLDSSHFRFLSPGYYGRGPGWLGVVSSYGGGSTPFYTRGGTVAIGGGRYLIAYAVQTKGQYYSFVMYGRATPTAPEPEKVTGDSNLTIHLFNLSTLPVLTDVRPFELKAELALYEQYLQDFKELMASRSAMEEGPSRGGNLENLGLALAMYAADNDDVLPRMDTAEAFQRALEEYVESKNTFADPESGELFALNPTLSGKKLSDVEDPSNTIAVYQPRPGKDGKRGVALVDGSTRRLSETEWEELKAKSGIP